MGYLKKGENDIQSQHPELVKYWHPTLNDKKPDEVSSHCNDPYWWTCDEGHEYEASPDKRLKLKQCPICSGRRLLPGVNDLETKYPNIARDWDYSLNKGTPRDYPFRDSTKVHWVCATCGFSWVAQINRRVDSKYQLCPKCTDKVKGEERHKKELAKRGGITDPRLLADWDYEMNEKGPEEYTPNSDKSVSWLCHICGHRWTAKINNRANGRGCPCCANQVVNPEINSLAKTHPKLAAEWHPTKNRDLKPTDVTYGMADLVWWLCPEGHEYQATINHRSGGTNCPICNSGRQTSFAEQAVFFYVKKVFPDAINRYTEIFSKGMELDIYIPSIKLGIEYDGEAWHKEDKREREMKKYRICQEHGIRLMRLMEKPVKNIFQITADEALSIQDGPMYEKEHLAKVIRFLLDKIDPETNMWTGRYPFFHSRVDINLDRDELEIRSYMTKLKEGSFASLFPEIAKEWHPTKNALVTPDKVKPYTGDKYWWICPTCGREYEASVASRSSGSSCEICGRIRAARKRSKAVVMLDPVTSEELRRFDSIQQASKELGISDSNITSVCKGNRDKAGGYGWRYADEIGVTNRTITENGQFVLEEFL